MRRNGGRNLRTLRAGAVLLGFALVLMVVVSNSPAAYAALGDRAADRVLGQPTFFTGTANNGSLPTAAQLFRPHSVFIDQSSRLFVADRSNWRVQSWSSASSLANGAPADFSIALTTTVGAGGVEISPDPIAAVTDASGNLYLAEMINNRILVYQPYTATAPSFVLGQLDLIHYLGNQGQAFPTASTLSGPYSLAVDGNKYLFVADLVNSRVLRFKLPIVMNNQAADLSLGQAGFDLGLANRGNPTPGNNTLSKPQGVAVDSAGTVYVADSDNHRVLKYVAPFSNGMAASLVLGQSDFVSGLLNQGGGTSYPTERTLNKPSSVAVDKFGRIYVSDFGNSRAVGYNPRGLVNGGAAEFLIGQPNFKAPATGPAPPTELSLGYPYGIAVNSAADLFAVDRDNNRVLGYDFPWGWKVSLPLLTK